MILLLTGFYTFKQVKLWSFLQISNNISGKCSRAFSASRKTFWLLFGHSDGKSLASTHNVTGLSYYSFYTCFKSSQGCDAGGSKYFRIYWLLKTTAQFGTIFYQMTYPESSISQPKDLSPSYTPLTHSSKSTFLFILPSSSMEVPFPSPQLPLQSHTALNQTSSISLETAQENRRLQCV